MNFDLNRSKRFDTNKTYSISNNLISHKSGDKNNTILTKKNKKREGDGKE